MLSLTLALSLREREKRGDIRVHSCYSWTYSSYSRIILHTPTGWYCGSHLPQGIPLSPDLK